MKAIIIGTGIIGVCSAYYMQQAGFDVELIENNELNGTSSTGNLGMIVPSHFIPLASPGIIAKGLKWLLNSKSPFYIRASLNANLIKWGWQFIKNATKENCVKAAHPLTALNVFSRELYLQMPGPIQNNTGLIQKGIVMYYKTDKAAEEEIHVAEMAGDLGLDVKVLNKTEAQELEPTVELNVEGGVYYKCDAHLNPNILLAELRSSLLQNGAVIHNTQSEITFEKNKNAVTKVNIGDKAIDADLVILASGVWLPAMAKQLNIHIPMVAGKGYTFDEPNEPQLLTPCILTEARVAITPMGNTIRYGGTMEIGTMNNKVNMKRVQGITESANNYFKNIHLQLPEKKNVWFGYRPCSPDGLPYLGYLKNYKNVIIAGGHSMMGLSMAAGTGKIVAEMAAHQKPSVDISIFNPERFA